MTSVAALHNMQPHISKVESGLVPDTKYNSKIFTFMLPHKHFDLQEGEALWVEKNDEGYMVSVKCLQDLSSTALPCMWLFDKCWTPYAYTSPENGRKSIPDVIPGGYNIGMRWLNQGGVEDTNEVKREQTISISVAPLGQDTILTMMNVDTDAKTNSTACTHTKTCTHCKNHQGGGS